MTFSSYVIDILTVAPTLKMCTNDYVTGYVFTPVFMIILKGRLPPENPRLIAANLSKHCKTKTDPFQTFTFTCVWRIAGVTVIGVLHSL